MWVAAWKEEYKEISKEIRSLRIMLQQPHGDISGYYAEAARNQSKKAHLRWKAHTMMELRSEGKKKSWEMKQTQLHNKNEVKA